MKGKIYLYLFVFSLLVNVFQYVNSKGIIDKYEKDIKKFKAKIEVLETENTITNKENAVFSTHFPNLSSPILVSFVLYLQHE